MTEKEISLKIKRRRFMKPQTPSLTVDTVILFKNRLVLVKRKNPPIRENLPFPAAS